MYEARYQVHYILERALGLKCMVYTYMLFWGGYSKVDWRGHLIAKSRSVHIVSDGVINNSTNLCAVFTACLIILYGSESCNWCFGQQTRLCLCIVCMYIIYYYVYLFICVCVRYCTHKCIHAVNIISVQIL